MAGPGSDPRLLGATWVSEAQIAAEQTDAARAREHRVEDFVGATTRARKPRSGLSRLARAMASRLRFRK